MLILVNGNPISLGIQTSPVINAYDNIETNEDRNDSPEVLRVVITSMSDGSPWIAQFDPEARRISFFEYDDGSMTYGNCRENQDKEDFWLLVSINAQAVLSMFHCDSCAGNYT